MIVRVGPDTPTVEDVQNLRQLHVELTVDDATAATALAESGLGTLEGDHVWLNIANLKSAGTPTDDWRQNFDAMIAYAKTKDWVDGDRVRTHIVRPSNKE